MTLHCAGGVVVGNADEDGEQAGRRRSGGEERGEPRTLLAPARRPTLTRAPQAQATAVAHAMAAPEARRAPARAERPPRAACLIGGPHLPVAPRARGARAPRCQLSRTACLALEACPGNQIRIESLARAALGAALAFHLHLADNALAPAARLRPPSRRLPGRTDPSALRIALRFSLARALASVQGARPSRPRVSRRSARSPHPR